MKKISDFVDGLYVEGGRLINSRAPGESGIAQAARDCVILHPLAVE